ncbi:ACT domain-containing protein [Pyrococcus furiosus DSM 3638]|uniref:ACT domain-containing protein n=3 Tax=Pyrococcus furiosus TaxID=2261 RepID=Q8U087_PYRFU|nr:ACT domain-containing protein [Pyrococcus furiosus]AAL81836.1 hypothetical protein PF1712 [Pyrococcus furiosus DSM 3638]AFN04928.1 hypothetical protein PFC_10045 [Pyrococcus furiosus COM1]QEK79329.1 ACT domain-containing protein [Pyrococcus furiosus DSM 3638]
MKKEEEKPSIAKLVKEYIETKPCIRELMILGIVNYSALARFIEGEFKKKGIKASTGAIKMALIRLGEELSEERSGFEKAIKNVISKTVIQLQSDLVVITARRDIVLSKIKELVEVAKDSRFFQLTQGIETFTIAMANEEKEKILELLKGGIIDVQEGQTAILLISPLAIINTPGIVAFITTALAVNGINITQIISCYKDTILLVDRRNAPSAYTILEDLIIKMREL